MDILNNPQLTRKIFVASTVMMIVAVALSAYNAAAVLSAPLRTATGVPSTVGFEGFLADGSGAPLANGTYTLTFRVYDVATGGSALWTEQQNSVQATNGLYSTALGSVTPFTSNTFNGDRWIGVTVDTGSEIAPRTRVSSVPFALNADNSNRIGGGDVAGIIALFDGPCPGGWSEYTAAQGRYVIGLPPGGTIGATVGTALGDQENRPVGQHNHTVNDPGHMHHPNSTGPGSGSGYLVTGTTYDNWTSSSVTTGITIGSAGSVAGTNAPYLQLRYCKLNP